MQETNFVSCTDIGSVPVAAITTAYLNQYYSRLLNEPAKLRKCSNGEKTLISASVIEKIHRLLRSAFNYAISIDMAQAVEGNFFSGVQDKANEGNVQDEKMRKALNVLHEHPELSELIVRLASG